MAKSTIRDKILSTNNINLDDFNPLAIAQKIADNLKEKRLALNMTQNALALRSGVSLGTLKRFESNAEISLKNLLMIAVALQSTEEFYNLFSKQQYQSIDEVLQVKKAKTRKRGRRNV